jgi:phosphoglycerate dehydrogenase-like enzyme
MNLLLTGAVGITDNLLLRLKQQGWIVDLLKSETDKLDNPAKYDAVICNSLFLHTSIEEFVNLKMIHLTSAGLDRVPLDYILNSGIQLFNARGVYSIPMAEWVVATILYEYKRLPFFSSNQMNRKWEKNRSLRELSGKKIAIIGVGNVGEEIAKRLKPFNTIIEGFDIKPKFNSEFDIISNIENFSASEYDIIILTAPHTSLTHHILNSNNLYTLKEGSIILALSRGGLIDEIALIKALSNRPDLTAILDVFDEEPLKEESDLWNVGNLRIFPHNSFVGEYNQYRLHSLILNNIGDFIIHASSG